MRVYFLRHGESVGNVQGLEAGFHPERDKLTELGRRQARQLGERLKDEGLSHLICSKMIRAQETAEEVNKVLGLPLETFEPAHEVLQAPEEFHDQTPFDWAKLSTVWMAQHADDPNYSVADAESFATIIKRVRQLKSHLLETHEDDTVGVISHGTLLRFFLMDTILGDDFSPAMAQYIWNIRSFNTGITIFDYDDMPTTEGLPTKGWRLVTWMDHAHL